MDKATLEGEEFCRDYGECGTNPALDRVVCLFDGVIFEVLSPSRPLFMGYLTEITIYFIREPRFNGVVYPTQAQNTTKNQAIIKGMKAMGQQ